MDQKKVLWDLSEKTRLIYNFALDKRKQRYKQNKNLPKKERNYISYEDQQNQLPALKKQYPEYSWVYSKVLQMTLKKLDANYKSFFGLLKSGNTNAKPPKFRGSMYFQTLSYNQSGFKLKKNILSFSHKHPLKINLNFKLDLVPQGLIKQVEIFQDYKKRWFVSVNEEFIPPEYEDNRLYQAIDLGISNIVSASNLQSKLIQVRNKRPEKFWNPKIDEVKSKRDHCIKNSKRWKRYNDKISLMSIKKTNQIRDFQHKISKVTVNNTKANTIIVGDLDIKKMAKKQNGQSKAQKTLNHSLQNTGSMGRFAELLTYKAEKVGKRVIKISERNTTKTCCVCGKMENRKLSERTIKCNCGNTMDRDHNSSINILLKFLWMKYMGELNEFKNSLLQQPSMKEESFLNKYKLGTDLLRQTAKRKMKVPQLVIASCVARTRRKLPLLGE